MFALLLKQTDEVAVIVIDNGLTMPALFVKKEDALATMYKNDLHDRCYISRVRPEIYMVNDENTTNPE